LTLNEDLLAMFARWRQNLSSVVESLLAEYLVRGGHADGQAKVVESTVALWE